MIDGDNCALAPVPLMTSEYADAWTAVVAMFTVNFCVPLIAVGPLMGDIGAWFDRRSVMPAAFHCHDMDDGVEAEASFASRMTGRNRCAIEFEGVSLALRSAKRVTETRLLCRP